MARMKAYHVARETLVWKTFYDYSSGGSYQCMGPGLVIDHSHSGATVNPDLLVVLWPSGKTTKETLTNIHLNKPHTFKTTKARA